MFTGIIEAQGQVEEMVQDGTNLTFIIYSPVSCELKPDQSISHDGVCLTVESINGNEHRVTAIAETISKTNLNQWRKGRIVNLERCMLVGSRLDGHLVQGHIDATGVCESVEAQNGSWVMQFSYPGNYKPMLIEKGSICLNGISLTCFGLADNRFSVAIIPYTYQHTNMHMLKPGDTVNLEFDVIAKYLNRWKELSRE